MFADAAHLQHWLHPIVPPIQILKSLSGIPFPRECIDIWGANMLYNILKLIDITSD